jgi:Trk-type K+ transport system membrane component
MVSEMIKELNNRNTFTTLTKIIGLTIAVELIGALFIYISVVSNPAIKDPGFFALFHAISAFCNAGFSTLTNNLYEHSVKFNYFFQLVIAWLIISGGISYSVMINHNSIIKNKLLGYYRWLSKKPKVSRVIKINTNNALIMKTSAILLLFGTIVFYFNEQNTVLKEHSFFGKIVVSFFNSVTPRTAGFNNVNMADLTLPTFMLILFLMWVGASPGSTGGGIKTTTFAIAMLNLFNQIKGRTKLIYRWREIPLDSINQANAVIFLSFFAIGLSTMFLAYFEKNILFKDLLFESISAYGTVGLSMGITFNLSSASKIVLIITMFVGRVSFLTILIGLYRQFFKEHKRELATYPTDNVFIN